MPESSRSTLWRGRRHGLTWLAIIPGILLLCWPALWNGYPLIWWDTKGYLDGALDGRPHWARSPFYGLMLRPLLAFGTAWPIVLFQGLMAAAVIYLVLRVVLGRRPAGTEAATYLLVVAILAAFSALPWVASIVLADVFTGLLALALFLLAFGRRELTVGQLIFAELAAILSTLAHYSHLPLAAGLALAIVVVLLILGRSWPEIGRSAGLLMLPVVLAAAGQLGYQWYGTGRLTISPYGQIFYLARMTDGGIVKLYLQAHCATRPFVLCEDIDRLPMPSEEFMWRDTGPLRRAGGPDAYLSEAKEIVAGSLHEDPAEHLKLALRGARDQLTNFATTQELTWFDFGNEEGSQLGDFLHRRLPADAPMLEASRQWQRPETYPRVDLLDLRAVKLSIILLILFAIPLYRRQAGTVGGLIAVCVMAVIMNAAICGILSGPHSRYGARIIWLLPLAAAVGGLVLRRLPAPEAASPGAPLPGPSVRSPTAQRLVPPGPIG